MTSVVKWALSDLYSRCQTFKLGLNSLAVHTGESPGGHSEDLLALKVALPSPDNRLLNVRSGSYEGGFAIWEGTWALVSFLTTIPVEDDWEVLEIVEARIRAILGAGLGICGSQLLTRGVRATFQDLNLNVLLDGLVPNLLLGVVSSRHLGTFTTSEEVNSSEEEVNSSEEVNNTGDVSSEQVNTGDVNTEDVSSEGEVELELEHLYEGDNVRLLRGKGVRIGPSGVQLPAHFRLLSGNWRQLLTTDKVREELEQKYHLLLSSESIYRTEDYEALAGLVALALKEGGTCIIATKRFYYGLSGGTFPFLSFLDEYRAESGVRLEGKVVRSFEPKSSSNVIDIIEVTKCLISS